MQQMTEDTKNYFKSIFINTKKIIAKLSSLHLVPLHIYMNAHMNSTHDLPVKMLHFITPLCRSGHDTTPHTKNPYVHIAT